MQTKDVFGTRYRLDQRIAAGGMGDVWAARDELLGRPVALKVLHPHLAADDGFRRRFRAEAKAAARLSHPGIVAVYDYGEDPDAAYLAMELVDGQPLNVVLRRRGRLDAPETMSLVAQTAEALAAAHAEGLVHRDVKPGNLMIRPDGRVKVTDFGIVRAADASTLTRDGSVFGTVSYMSPEQIRGERVTDASDVYSLGVVAYECLSGSRPYRGDESIAIALAHLHDPVPPLPSDVPAGVRQIVLRMLHKDPASRPASADAVAQTARRLSADGKATWALGELGGTIANDVAETAIPGGTGGWAAPYDSGPPTGELTVDNGRDGRVEAVALAGLAEPQTIALPPPRPLVLRPPTPRRQWPPVVGLAVVALVVALAFAVFSGGTPARTTVPLPRLRGTTLKIAEHRVTALGLHPTVRNRDPSLDDMVVGERPGAGTAVARGSTVTLTVRESVTHQQAATTTTAPPPPPATQPIGPATNQTNQQGPPHGHGHGHGGG